MKTIIIACGSGIATSTVICEGIEKLLNEHAIPHRIYQCSLNEMYSHLNEADLVVSSMAIGEDLGIPNVVGLPYLLGMGVEQLNENILKILKEEN